MPSPVSRRRFLGALGALTTSGAVAAAATGLAPIVFEPDPVAAAEQRSRRLRRWAMVIDLRRCDGCQSVGKPPQCTAACIQGHFAPEPMEWIQVYEGPLAGQ
ncbi:MAG TPA: hypothetical protein VGR61_00665, partial [Candidatus Dormibacteraeota bacterium]|nr:hypothetical protein [Candidatus Dormibacteraeota bacterium]